MRSRLALRAILALTSWALCSSVCWSQTIDDVLKRRPSEEPADELSGLGYPSLRVKEEEAAIPFAVPKAKEEAELGLDKRVDPEEYVVGPRDKLTVYIWGQLDQPFVLDVTPEGTVFFPTVGVLDVSGHTLADVKRMLIEKARAFYQERDISVVLSVLRSFRVFVTGMVDNPGTYRASAVDRVSDVIENAGGLAGAGYSMRNIAVTHSDGTTTLADISWFFQTGSVEYNPYVRMGDIIHVPPRQSVVDIFGAVHSPGAREFRKGDTVATILSLAGGVLENAYLAKVEVVRFCADGTTTQQVSLDLSEPARADSCAQFPLMPDDCVFVRSHTEWHVKRRATIMGEVKYPGAYLVERDATRLRDVVQQAGGFTQEASLEEAQVVRRRVHSEVDPEYERLRTMSAADMTPQEYEYYKTQSRQRRGVLAVDFVKLFRENNEGHNVMLADGDLIYVPRQRETVSLTGQVKLPGLVAYEPERGADFYIRRSGGYSWNADKGRSKVIKGSTGLWLQKDEAGGLEPGDSVFIPEKPDRDWWVIFKDTVSAFGQVATVVILARSIATH